MSAVASTAVAVPVAVGAAASFGAAALLQHQASRQAPRSGPLNPRLLWDLVGLPHFRWSILLGVVGFALQVVALRYAPLAIVQPLLVTGVIFYLGFGSIARRRRPDAVLLSGVVLALAGLIGFLLISRPSAGTATFTSGAALPLGICLVVLVGACLLAWRKLGQEYRIVPLAGATAVCYGVTATLVRSLLATPSLSVLISRWELYAVIVVAPTGFLLNQNAFQQGRAGSLALTITTVGDPVVAIGAGAAWLSESLRGGAWVSAGEVVLLMLMAAGIVLLAERAQQMSEQLRDRDSGPSVVSC